MSHNPFKYKENSSNKLVTVSFNLQQPLRFKLAFLICSILQQKKDRMHLSFFFCPRSIQWRPRFSASGIFTVFVSYTAFTSNPSMVTHPRANHAQLLLPCYAKLKTPVPVRTLHVKQLRRCTVHIKVYKKTSENR